MKESNRGSIIIFIIYIVMVITLCSSAYDRGKKDFLEGRKGKDMEALEDFLLYEDAGREIFYKTLDIELDVEDNRTMKLIKYYEELRGDYED